MQKFLRTLMLAALMLPFASQAQETLTVHDGTTTNNVVPAYIYYFDDFTRSQFVIPAADLTAMNGTTISAIKFYTTASNVPYTTVSTVNVYMKEVSYTTMTALEPNTGAEMVYTGTLEVVTAGSGGEMTITLASPYTYQGGNLLIGIENTTDAGYKIIYFYGETVTGASWGGYNSTDLDLVTGSARNFIPKTTFTYQAGQITCNGVKNLAIDTATSNSMTLSWIDTNNATGTTYNLYTVTATDTTPIVGATGLTAMTYTVTGLDANTRYTFGVEANCGAEDGLSSLRTVSGRTACGAVSLPYSTGFEAADLMSGSNPLPYCWARYNSAGSFYPYAQSNTSYSTYSRSGSNCLNFYMGSGASYADTVMAILPLVNVTTYPMNNNELRFWARTTSASASIALQIGTLTDPEDPTTFVLDQEITVSGNTYMEYEALLGVNSTGAYPAIRIFKPESTVTVYIDDLFVEVRPSCLKPLVTVTPASSSVNLSWEDANTGATYSVIKVQGTDTAYTTTNNATITFEELPENTNYTFIVRALCSADDSSRAATLATRTLRSGHKMTAFNLTGTGKRDNVVVDTVAEPYTLTAPVWYTDNLSTGYTFTWTISTSAGVYIDTTGDGSFTCKVTTTTIKDYLQMNVPIVLRVKAEDQALYTDYTLTLVTEDCVKDRNLALAPERIRYTATWDNPDSMVITHYFVNSDTRLTAEDLAGVNPVIVNNAHQYTVEGLNRATKYYAYLKAACDTVWIEDSVTTQDLGACLDVVIADGTGTNGYVPLYGNYAELHQRIQSIYPASMLVNMMGVTISDIHYFVSSGSSANWGGQTWEVSLGITEQENLQNGWVDTTLLTRVYTGTLSASAADGMTIVFDQPFTYTGGNLVVQFVQRVPNSYTSCTFRGLNSGVSYASRYAYPANTDDLWAAAGSTANFLPKFNFTYCLPANACPDVTGIAVDSLTNTSALIEWTASDADYCVGNQIIVSPTELDSAALADVNGAIPLAADATSYNATGLTPDHDYYVYVKALCNGDAHPEGTSGWASYQFRTYPNVRTPEVVTATFMGKHLAFFGLQNTGSELGQPTNFSYYYSTTELDADALATITPMVTGIDTLLFFVDSLESATTYYFYFRNEMNGEVSPWSAPAVVTMPPAMPAVVDLTVTDASYNAMTATWAPNIAQFANETAWRAAIVQHGQQPADDDWQTVTSTYEMYGGLSYGAYNIFIGLTPDTAYDIYVAAYDVESGATSDTVILDSVRTAKFPGNGIIVADSTATNGYVMLRSQYQDTDHRSQVIYPASMLTALQGKTMTAMRFYSNYVSSIRNEYGDWTENNFVLKLAVTANENLASAWDATEGDTVFDGSISTVVEDGQLVFEFDTPFQYNGGNLLVELLYDDSFGNRYTSGSFYGMTADNASRYANGSDALTTAPGTVQNFLPKVMIDYEGASTCLPVSTVYIMDVTDINATAMWYPGYEETAWEYAFSTSDSMTAAELEDAALPVTTNNVALSGLVRDANYTFYVRPVCSETETGNWTSWTFPTPYVDYFYNVIAEVNDEEMGMVESLIEVLEGTDTILVAEANPGYHFVNWTMGNAILGTEDTLEITVDSNMTIMANFASDTFHVTFAVNDATMGTISPAGVQAYVMNDPVTITATPNMGYHLVGWNLLLPGLIDTTLVTDGLTYEDTINYMWDGGTLTAIFEVNDSITMTFGVNYAEAGSITPAGEQHFVEGTIMTFTATPNAGYHLAGWMIIDDGQDTLITEDLELTISDTVVPFMDSSAIYAVFAKDAPLPVEATIAADAIDYKVGTGSNEAVIAVNWANAAFAWAVKFNGSITVKDAMDTIAAYDSRFNYSTDTYGYLADITFAEDEISLSGDPMSYWQSNNGMDMGLAQTLTNGSFEKWAQPVAGVWVSSFPYYDPTPVYGGLWWIDSYVYDMDILPMWAPVPDSITMTFAVNDPNMGSITPNGVQVFAIGETVTITATPNAGYHLVSWHLVIPMLDVDTTVDAESEMSHPDTVSMFLDGAVFTANFEANPVGTYTVVVNVNDPAMGHVDGVPTGAVAEGTQVTLRAVANQGYVFDGWSDGVTTAERTITVTEDIVLTANFKRDPSGIDNVEGIDALIYSTNNRIVVKGAENMNVYVYDVNGRCVSKQANAPETIEFTMQSAGVYLVKVGKAPAKRVVVVR
ncbi:MAG: fibronectin type III domain-containing protein [Bacteroidales bacterium]|nr:fibronectin type III domain-containing protein [Bacteroidales bacterium]